MAGKPESCECVCLVSLPNMYTCCIMLQDWVRGSLYLPCLSSPWMQERSGSTVPSILNRMSTNDAPPTYFKTNKFTRGYQAIVNSYGVANYGEVNPSTSRDWTCSSSNTPTVVVLSFMGITLWLIVYSTLNCSNSGFSLQLAHSMWGHWLLNNTFKMLVDVRQSEIDVHMYYQ